MNGHTGRILVVDDEATVRNVLSEILKTGGYSPLCVSNGEDALKTLQYEFPDVMLVDFKMPRMDGMELLKWAKALDPEVPVVMVTAFADVQGAVEAMKAGASDYLAKPFSHNDIIRVVLNGLCERNNHRRLKELPPAEGPNECLRKKMGPSESILRIVTDVSRVAKSNFSVVIVGETGSGKELVARAIHEASPMASGPFVPVDCGAIPETLIESELFGYEKGAFTGADRQSKGKFEAAEGGTLFLDEIANMPLASQAKLLRVLQEKVFYRVGGTEPKCTNVRVLAATNEELNAKVGRDEFRKDLFFRLNEFTIRIPALRERKEDILYLANRLLERTNEELNKAVKGFSEEAIGLMLAYEWPGNVRELRACVRRAVLLADGLVRKEHLDIAAASCPMSAAVAGPIAWEGRSLSEIVRDGVAAMEREVLQQTLSKTGGNKAKAARSLQIDYKTIHKKVKQYGLRETGKV